MRARTASPSSPFWPSVPQPEVPGSFLASLQPPEDTCTQRIEIAKETISKRCRWPRIEIAKDADSQGYNRKGYRRKRINIHKDVDIEGYT